MCSRYRGKQITVSYLIELVGETKVTTITKDNNNNKRITIQTMRSREDPSAQAWHLSEGGTFFSQHMIKGFVYNLRQDKLATK